MLHRGSIRFYNSSYHKAVFIFVFKIDDMNPEGYVLSNLTRKLEIYFAHALSNEMISCFDLEKWIKECCWWLFMFT